MVAALWLVRNKHLIIPLIEDTFGISWKEENLISHDKIEDLVPEHSFKDEFISRESYVLSFDQEKLQPRFTIHMLTDTMTRGTASRYGLRINDAEKIYSHTAKWDDYSYSGYDRGHMVPAGDYSCCQNLLEDTFRMTNIAAFDSVLNRYAWRELESYTRQMARRYQQIFVITGTVFQDNQYIRGSNRVGIPSHFYKILIRKSSKTERPKAVAAFILANKPIFEFSKRSHATSIDAIEAMTGLDYFSHLENQIQENFESQKLVGSW